MGALIVVVDDDDANRMVASEILSDAGFRVLALASVTELRRAMTNERPSLVILDGGLSAAGRSHILGKVPVIVVSAAHGEQVARAASSINARAWLRKPFDMDELVALVREHATGG